MPDNLWWEANIGSGNGVVPSGNKPLPKPMLTQIDITMSLGHNELIQGIYHSVQNYIYVCSCKNHWRHKICPHKANNFSAEFHYPVLFIGFQNMT